MRKVLASLLVATLSGALSPVVAAADAAIVIVSHEVTDFAAWKKRFDAGKESRAKAGLTERYVMRDANKPNMVIVVLGGSVENAKKFAADPGFQERVKKASATGTAEIRIGVQ